VGRRSQALTFPVQELSRPKLADFEGVPRSGEQLARNGKQPTQAGPIIPVMLLADPIDYTKARCDVTIEAVESLFNDRNNLRGLEMTYEPKYLRFFQARFKPRE
jgi:tryptophanase